MKNVYLPLAILATCLSTQAVRAAAMDIHWEPVVTTTSGSTVPAGSWVVEPESLESKMTAVYLDEAQLAFLKSKWIRFDEASMRQLALDDAAEARAKQAE